MGWYNEKYVTLLLVIVFISVLVLSLVLVKIASSYIHKSQNPLAEFLLQLFKVPMLLLICWGLFNYISTRIASVIYINYFNHINSIILILLFALIFIKLTKALTKYFQTKLDLDSDNNIEARTRLTHIKVFQKIVTAIIILLTISFSLLTFDAARTIGISILTSAGIAGIMFGFAAQKSLSMILAGIQIAITQPIRLDDVVIVEGEWGRIEEINLTYVVVNIWDERRLIVPVNYFLEKPFQNWTKTNSEILGTIFLQLDYNFPVDKIRSTLDNLLHECQDWDGRVANVQVTNTNELGKEIRILVSSKDASKNWDLRTYIREQIINWINNEYPNSFVRQRVRINEA